MKEKLKLARCNLALEIKKSKRESWRKLIGDLESDPFGRAYKALTHRIKRAKRHDSHSLSAHEIRQLTTKLFPKHKSIEWLKPEVIVEYL